MRLFILPAMDAILLIVIGAFIWISNLGLIHIVWRRDWPLIIVLIGVAQFFKYLLRSKK